MPQEFTRPQPIPWQEAGVISTNASPAARLRPIPVRAVEMVAGFWRSRMETNVRISLPKQLQMLRETGTLENFKRVYGASKAPFAGPRFADSDIYKWLEAASFALQTERSAELEASIDEAIAVIAPAQGADGYLNTYFQFERFGDRWTKLESDHELYCAGHLFQAAVAHYRATGNDSLLNIACRFADYIHQVFGPGRRQGRPGHPEVEMGLIELYRETGERRYLDTAGYFLEQAGGKTMREIFGHAVRALYFCSGLADYYLESGDPAYLATAEALWKSMTETKMYVTGAVGGRVHGEAFGREFELPNENAYAETCAAIASFMWNWRMLAQKGEARYADLMELTLYNSVLSGISLDGEHYFYVNPHASSGRPTADYWWPMDIKGAPTRQGWFGCACCPPNVARIFASLPGYFYSTSAEGLWVHLYDANTLRWRSPGGAPLTLTQATRYPWDGRVEISLTLEKEEEFALYLRIPEWCQAAALAVNGETLPAPQAGSYCEIRRRWGREGRIVLDMSMSPTPMICNPMAPETRCSVAMKRGPLVYCFESVDNPGFSVRAAKLPVDARHPDAAFLAAPRPDLLGGVVILRGRGAAPTEPWGLLYRPLSAEPAPTKAVELVGIPYYAWDNRGIAEMTVWLQRE